MALEWVDLLRIMTGLTCLLVFMLGVRWQARTFRADVATGQVRMKSALLISVLTIVGVTVWAGFAAHDVNINLSFLDAGKYVGGIGLVCLAFLFNSWLGPLFVSASLSWAAFMLLEHGQLELLPVYEWLIQVLGEDAPPGSPSIYGWATVAHALAGSVYISLAPGEQIWNEITPGGSHP